LWLKFDSFDNLWLYELTKCFPKKKTYSMFLSLTFFLLVKLTLHFILFLSKSKNGPPGRIYHVCVGNKKDIQLWWHKSFALLDSKRAISMCFIQRFRMCLCSSTRKIMRVWPHNIGTITGGVWYMRLMSDGTLYIPFLPWEDSYFL